MKNKKLIILFSILVFFTVLIVLSSTLFTLQNLTINWMTDTKQLSKYKDYEITENIALGESIFLVDKDEIASTLEKKYPYLRVVGLETKFPNKIVLHTAEREGLYAIKKSDGNYVILDEYGKVIEGKVSYEEFVKMSNSSLGGAPIEINFDNLTIKDDDMLEGEFIKVASVKDLLNNLSLSLRQSSHTPTTSKGVFKYINVTSLGESEIVSIETRRGIIIELKDAENYTTDKLLLGLSTYNDLHKQGVVNGIIEVFYSDKLDKNVAVG